VDKILYRLKELGITKYEREFGFDKVEWKIKGSEYSIKKFKIEYQSK